MKKLKLNDSVNWRGAWGTQPPIKVKVIGIQICADGSKYGRDVKSVSWDVISNNGRKVVVDLDNGHWAYGNQLSEIK